MKRRNVDANFKMPRFLDCVLSTIYIYYVFFFIIPMLHGCAGDPDVTVEMVEVELRREADLPAVVLVGVAAVQDHIAGHEGGGVEGHLGGGPALPRVHHLAPAQPVQLQQVDLVAQFTAKMSLESWDVYIHTVKRPKFGNGP